MQIVYIILYFFLNLKAINVPKASDKGNYISDFSGKRPVGFPKILFLFRCYVQIWPSS